MSEPVSPVAPYSREEFLSSRSLEYADEAVDELFGTMLGVAASTTPPTENADISPKSVEGHPSDLSATIRFAGPMRGACEIRMSPPAAGFVASILLGGPVADGDDSIGDTVGEVCNIIGGGWKNRTFDFEARCTLTPPVVHTGSENLLGAPSAHIRRTYVFEEHTLSVTITQEDMAA